MSCFEDYMRFLKEVEAARERIRNNGTATKARRPAKVPVQKNECRPPE